MYSEKLRLRLDDKEVDIFDNYLTMGNFYFIPISLQ